MDLRNTEKLYYRTKPDINMTNSFHESTLSFSCKVALLWGATAMKSKPNMRKKKKDQDF